MTKLKENLIAFVGALLLTMLVIFLINWSWTNFATDVLWIQKNVIEWDLIAYQSWNQIIVKSNKDIPNVYSLIIEVSFNPEKVKINPKNIDSIGDVNIQVVSSWNLYVPITNLKEINKDDIILKISNVGKDAIDNINFWHIQVIDNNSNTLNLTLAK